VWTGQRIEYDFSFAAPFMTENVYLCEPTGADPHASNIEFLDPTNFAGSILC
jgi:hypothetical protein